MSSKINRNSRTFFYKFRSSVLWKLREFRLMEVSLETLVWMMWIKELFRMQYSWRSAKWPVWLLHEHYIRWTFIFKLWDFTDDLYNPTYIQFVNKKRDRWWNLSHAHHYKCSLNYSERIIQSAAKCFHISHYCKRGIHYIWQ